MVEENWHADVWMCRLFLPYSLAVLTFLFFEIIFAGPCHLLNALVVESGIRISTESPIVNDFSLDFRLY